ncbi:MAG TPA: 6-phosphogluconolactonase [Chitinophagaceae bacterium]
MKVNIFKTVQELLIAMADYFISISQSSIASRGQFNVALSGGSSPKRLYEMLASTDFKDQVEWNKINFFFGDERYVPDNDPGNNSLMVKKALFDPLKIAPPKIFSINTSLSPEESATKYTSTIAKHFKGRKIQFDLILLGLGDNSHTASLFPNTSVLDDKSASVKAVFVEEKKAFRITMTAPLINQAQHIAFLVYGKAKANAVYNVLENDDDPKKFPARLIHPENGDLQWYLDESAASRLTKEFKRGTYS